MTLNELFKNTTYDDTLFSVEDKSTIESRIFMKSVRGSEVPYITCAIRDKEIKLTPEEAVRQLYNVLHLNTLDYSRWGETTKQEDWIDTYNEGFKKLKKLQPAGVKDYSQFQFDLVMAKA